MNKKFTKQFIEEQKEVLEKEKKRLEKELSFLAKRNQKIKGDWITNYPKFGSGDLEEQTDEIEEYGNLLPVVSTLELELKKVQEALERIRKGKYGICDKCKKPILKARLRIYPQADSCTKCKK